MVSRQTMDFFAIVLLTITILTICGICLFIFLCTLQPRIIRRFHQKKHRTYYITKTRKLSRSLSGSRLSNRDSLMSRSSVMSINHDKRIYLKIVERSVRTGRRIEDEKRAFSRDSLRQYLNGHLSSSSNLHKIPET